MAEVFDNDLHDYLTRLDDDETDTDTYTEGYLERADRLFDEERDRLAEEAC